MRSVSKWMGLLLLLPTVACAGGAGDSSSGLGAAATGAVAGMGDGFAGAGLAGINGAAGMAVLAGTGGQGGIAGTAAGTGALPGGAGGVAGTVAGTEAQAGMAGMAGMAGAAGMEPGMAGTGDMAGVSGGMAGTAGMTGGMAGMAGMTGGMAGMDAVTGGMGGAGGTGGPDLGGTCCPDGSCLCHGPDPSALTAANGPYRTTTARMSTGTVYYPNNAEGPFSAIAICGGFLNTGPEMNGWGTFYASHGIVTMITTTTGADFPPTRAAKLLASIAELKSENQRSGGPLYQKLVGRYGTSGYSMGGGGTTLASVDEPTLRTSVGLAAWAPVGARINVPTLLLCGGTDLTAPCSGSQTAYNAIPAATPKMMVTIPSTGHLSWFGPNDAGRGMSGRYALAFQKVFLDGDERWRPLLRSASEGTKVTNIQ